MQGGYQGFSAFHKIGDCHPAINLQSNELPVMRDGKCHHLAPCIWKIPTWALSKCMPLPGNGLKNRYGKNTEIIRNDLSIRPQSTSWGHLGTGQRLTLQGTDLVRHHEVILGYFCCELQLKKGASRLILIFLVACCLLAEPCSMHAFRGTYLFPDKHD